MGLTSQDLTPRAKDNLVSFGERMSTRIFASYLRTMVSSAMEPCVDACTDRKTLSSAKVMEEPWVLPCLTPIGRCPAT
eukprot:scaffold213640_cov15-Tisochrysis_lutea.AAC.1